MISCCFIFLSHGLGLQIRFYSSVVFNIPHCFVLEWLHTTDVICSVFIRDGKRRVYNFIRVQTIIFCADIKQMCSIRSTRIAHFITLIFGNVLEPFQKLRQKRCFYKLLVTFFNSNVPRLYVNVCLCHYNQ